MITVASQNWSLGNDVPKERFLAQYYALESLHNLTLTGNEFERRQLRDDMLEENLIAVCLQHMQRPLCIMHGAVITLLQTLAFDAFLGEQISSSVAADIIESVCLYTLAGPDSIISQMLDPDTAWQSSVFPNSGGILPIDKAAIFAPLYYSMVQDNAIGAAYSLMDLFPSHSHEFCLEVLKKKPRIVELLLDCAVSDRYPRHPETQVCMKSCSILGMFLQWPSHIVPGVPTPLDRSFKAHEWKAMLKMMDIFTSSTDWLEKLIELWMHVQEEDISPVQGMESVYGDRGTSFFPDGTTLFDLESYWIRMIGAIRIISLRLIATLTHAAESCGITNAQIESLLHICYRASGAGKLPHQCTSHQELFEVVEYGAEFFQYTTSRPATADPKSRASRDVGGIAVESPIVAAPQCLIGPTALVRLLVVLAQRNALRGIQALKKAPTGLSSSTSLGQVQHITHPDIIRRIIKISQSCIIERTERGRCLIREKKDNTDFNLACAFFVSSAELSAALVALDTYTDGEYAAEALGARKQLVIALGNASQMALNLGHYRRALHFGCGAVSAAEDIPAEEGLDPAITEKNQRRISQANAGLRRR
ncbi:hypothetical protein CONPUDRAFT_133538 [Coniophora puteana RWD-64-598 SS2]|uniref:Uncharacterized protein n=1 Tax=Coniophora puteana (strain RWD-64-598) TaxID=741705 RepID=R7SCX1_CONPW|nr:uncharacterized protein CONPUDRAFT_133538 [Coniophora puteana RWD-64-598 SS2]EIW74013.1 hypothetical protein CONPUDRAFT_133538 [Coniophora puteana RWD-64-598 SS2]